MADLSNSKIKDTYQFVLQADGTGNLQTLLGASPNPLIINNNLRYVDGNQQSGYVLKSDGNGNASWGEVSTGDLYISAATLDNTVLKLETTSGSTISVPVSYWSSDGLGNYSNSGLTGNIGVGTSTPNEKLTVVGAISATSAVHGNIFYSNSSYFAGGDRVIYTLGSNINLGDTDSGTVDKAVRITGTNIELNAPVTTFVGGVDIVGNMVTGGNVISTGLTSTIGPIVSGTTDLNDLFVKTSDLNYGADDFWSGETGNTLFPISPVNTKLGIGTSTPAAMLTVKGGLGFQIYNLNGGIVTFANGFNRVLFSNGASPANLLSGDEIKFSDGSETFTLIVDFISGANAFLTQNYSGANALISGGGLLFSSGEPLQFQTLGGSSPTFQISGTSVMSGTTDLLDIFAKTSDISYPTNLFWSGNTAGSLFPISPTNTKIGIGTSTPDKTLHVKTAENTVAVFESTDATVALKISDSSDDAYIVGKNNMLYISDTSGSPSSNAKFAFDYVNGKLGIATTTPNVPLTVVGDISGTTNLHIEGNINANGNIVGDDTTNITNIATLECDTIAHDNDVDNKIAFGTDIQDHQTGGSSRLDINDEGVRLGGAGARVTTIEDNDNLGTSDTKLPTQGNVKAYVDGTYNRTYISYFSSVSSSLAATNNWILPSVGGGISNHTWNVNSGYAGSNQTVGNTFTVASNGGVQAIPVPFDGILEGFYCNCRNNGSESDPRNAALFTSTLDWGTGNVNTMTLRFFGAGNDDGGSSNSKPYFINGIGEPLAVSRGDVIMPAISAQDGGSVANQCTWTVVLATTLSGTT
jgi:hypothetical protein|tara:strand:- start:829 stop:3255 length:2427 start_codon:yes stop_codon:yes gene_type:complete